MDGYGLTAATLLIAQVAFNIFIVSNSSLLVASNGQGGPKVDKSASMWWGIISTITFAVFYGIIAIMILFIQNNKLVDNVMIGLLLSSAAAAIAIATILYINVNNVILPEIERSRDYINKNKANMPVSAGGVWDNFYNAFIVVMTYPAHAAVSSSIVSIISSLLLFSRRYQNVSKVVGGLRSLFG